MQANSDFNQSLEHSPIREAWKRIGARAHHGINVALFSLRSEKSSGIGEFLDLFYLIDFCKTIGFDILQLLPLNDTGFDTSPYNALSSLALNPIYMSLWALPHLAEHKDLREDLVLFKKYNDLERVAYESVLLAKIEFLKKYTAATLPKFQKDLYYQKFKQSTSWLKPYALFKILKEEHHHRPWSEWEEDLKNPTKKTLEELYHKNKEGMEYHYLVQFLLSSQLKAVKKHAHQNGVFIMGDIPILVSPESFDVWFHREDFNLAFSAGAPPDAFSKEGQNWGFPIFNWLAVQEGGYAWWKTRLQDAEQYYDIYRIDHIIGFFRIWAIKRGEDAKQGSYIPSDEEQALFQGEAILLALTHMTEMLPIGEDLGGVNINKIRACLSKLGIPGYKVMRWERNYETTRAFISGDAYPPKSLTTLSTHDTETTSQWWIKEAEEAEDYCRYKNWTYETPLSEEKRFMILKDSHQTSSLFHVNLLSEYLALVDNLVYADPEKERINVPGTVGPSNWCYRMRPKLDEIIHHDDLIKKMRSLIA